MSLTSYRAAPPRGSQGSEDRYQESEGVGIRDVSFWHLILARPGGDRLSRALGRSTIGAEGFHGRVRDGIGCWPLAIATRPCRDQRFRDQKSGIRDQIFLLILIPDPRHLTVSSRGVGLVAASERV